MLKKAVTAEIIPATRICKCGTTVSINPTENKTFCNKCGELIHEDAAHSAGDSETESTDSE